MSGVTRLALALCLLSFAGMGARAQDTCWGDQCKVPGTVGKSITDLNVSGKVTAGIILNSTLAYNIGKTGNDLANLALPPQGATGIYGTRLDLGERYLFSFGNCAAPSDQLLHIPSTLGPGCWNKQERAANFPGVFGSTPTDIMSINIGNYPVAQQIPAGVPEGLVSKMVVPSSFNETPWPPTAIAAYIQNNNTASTNSAVGIFSLAESNANGANPYAANFVVNNASGGNGFDIGVIGVGLEINPNILAKTGGATPSGAIYGIYEIGASSIIPASGAYGLEVEQFGTGLHWSAGIRLLDNCCSTGLTMGAVTAGASAASQGINLNGYNSASVAMTATLQLIPISTSGYLAINTPPSGGFKFQVNGVTDYDLDGAGFYGDSASAIATNAGAPFVYLNATAGTPTGVPLNAAAGRTAIVNDTTNHKLCWYEQVNAVWKCAAGS